MRRWIWVLLLFAAGIQGAAAQTLDVMLWIPRSDAAAAASSNVTRDKWYYTVKLRSAYASYESGQLSDVNRLVVSSNTLTADPGYIGRSTIVHKVMQRGDRRGDLIPMDDYLVAWSPAIASEIVFKFGLRGLGEEESYKPVLESLADPALKSTLSLSSVTAPSIAALTFGVDKFLAPPYIASEGKQDLEITRTLYTEEENPHKPEHMPPGLAAQTDLLREGYIVLVSSKEKASDELEKIKTLAPKDLRLSAKNALEYKDGAAWKTFRKNSYVVLAVNRTAFRGLDEFSPWAKKYAAAIKTVAEPPEGGAAAGNDVVTLWREASALLAADPAYVRTERDAIKAYEYQLLLDAQKSRNVAALDTKALDVPADFAKLAQLYKEQGIGAAGQLVIESQDEKKKPRSGLYSRLVNLDAPTSATREGRTNFEGLYTFKTLVPGKYVFETWTGGEQPEKRMFIVEPKETKRLLFVIPTVYAPSTEVMQGR